MKKLLSTFAALACGATLAVAVAGAGPAQAAGSGCPANNFCLYSDPNPVDVNITFVQNGTNMFDHANYYFYDSRLSRYSSTYVLNQTQGYFCTYDVNLKRLGRFGPGTSKTIAAGTPYGTNWHVAYVRYCP